MLKVFIFITFSCLVSLSSANLPIRNTGLIPFDYTAYDSAQEFYKIPTFFQRGWIFRALWVPGKTPWEYEPLFFFVRPRPAIFARVKFPAYPGLFEPCIPWLKPGETQYARVTFDLAKIHRPGPLFCWLPTWEYQAGICRIAGCPVPTSRHGAPDLASYCV